jgi:hypothetical protein
VCIVTRKGREEKRREERRRGLRVLLLKGVHSHEEGQRRKKDEYR